MSLDPLFKRAFGDDEPTHFGSGWTSGVIAVVGGALSLFGVLCFRFPQLLTAPSLRSRYPVDQMRLLLAAVMLVTLLAGALSAWRRRRKVLTLTGLSLLGLATVLGGPWAPLPDTIETSVGLGLDWFLLNLLVLAAIFVPLERSKPQRPDQLVFRPGWTVDSVHFLVSHLLLQVVSFLVVAPATWIQHQVTPNPIAGELAALPLLLQFPLIVIVADGVQYGVHRAFHQVPFLWRFHAVHHSSQTLDWLAGFRLHLIDAVVTRALVLTPLIWLGFSQQALAAYLVFVSFHAVFIHANWGVNVSWLEPVLVTPRVHHFHHASDDEAIDKNFGVHVPWFDLLFGTRHAPKGQWPKAYGLHGSQLPESYLAQLVAPFRR